MNDTRMKHVEATVAITRTVNDLLGRGVDARVILTRMLADVVQLEQRVNAQYPGRLPSLETLLEHARALAAAQKELKG